MAFNDFDKLITETRPHILERMCLSLDFETFKNCLRVNKAWRGVLTNKVFRPKVMSKFRNEIMEEENNLIIMSVEGDTEGVRRILSIGLPNVDCNDEQLKPWAHIGPKTPLIYACSEGHTEIVRLLMSAGADVNQEGPSMDDMDEWQMSPLMVAANYNYYEVVKLLIDAGAQPDKVDQFGKTPLHLSAWNSNMSFKDMDLIPWDQETPIAVLKLLLDKGADVNRGDQFGTTPLIAAAYMGDCDVANLLLDRGADIEKANDRWRAPLMTAVDANNKEMVKLLIERGADITHGDGLTAPMGLAEEKGHREVLQMLFNASRFVSEMTLEEFLKAAHEDSDEDFVDDSDEYSDENEG